MKRMPSALIAFLQNNPTCHKADCFAIQLPTGQVLFATEGQWDITFKTTTPGWPGGQTTFSATQYGAWSRGKIASEASAKCAANTMDLSCIPQPTTTYPGLSVGLLNAALNHLFDGATVFVFTAYMPLGGYGNVSAGIETKFRGTITRTPKLGRNLVQFECADPMYLLNMKVPGRLYQSNCPWSFADANCSLDPNHFAVTVTATSGGSRTLSIAALTQADGYFTQGLAICLSGQNAGLAQTIKSYASGTIQFPVPWLLPIAAGDTFSVLKGCDKTPSACAKTVRADGSAEPQDFRTRFGGEPLVPAASSAI